MRVRDQERMRDQVRVRDGVRVRNQVRVRDQLRVRDPPSTESERFFLDRELLLERREAKPWSGLSVTGGAGLMMGSPRMAWPSTSSQRSSSAWESAAKNNLAAFTPGFSTVKQLHRKKAKMVTPKDGEIGRWSH